MSFDTKILVMNGHFLIFDPKFWKTRFVPKILHVRSAKILNFASFLGKISVLNIPKLVLTNTCLINFSTVRKCALLPRYRTGKCNVVRLTVTSYFFFGAAGAEILGFQILLQGMK